MHELVEARIVELGLHKLVGANSLCNNGNHIYNLPSIDFFVHRINITIFIIFLIFMFNRLEVQTRDELSKSSFN